MILSFLPVSLEKRSAPLMTPNATSAPTGSLIRLAGGNTEWLINAQMMPATRPMPNGFLKVRQDERDGQRIEGNDEIARDSAGHYQRYQTDDGAYAEQHAYDHDIFRLHSKHHN